MCKPPKNNIYRVYKISNEMLAMSVTTTLCNSYSFKYYIKQDKIESNIGNGDVEGDLYDKMRSIFRNSIEFRQIKQDESKNQI